MTILDTITFHVYPQPESGEDKWTVRRVRETLRATLIGADGKEITVEQAIGNRPWEATEGGLEEFANEHLLAVEACGATSLVFYDLPKLLVAGSYDPWTLKSGSQGYVANPSFAKAMQRYGVPHRRRGVPS